jgi:hypothetical protein
LIYRDEIEKSGMFTLGWVCIAGHRYQKTVSRKSGLAYHLGVIWRRIEEERKKKR